MCVTSVGSDVEPDGRAERGGQDMELWTICELEIELWMVWIVLGSAIDCVRDRPNCQASRVPRLKDRLRDRLA